jgi:formyl-CoA transferase
MAYPLAGVTVADLTQVMAGPYCTQLLGDLGAEVIKVEPVTGGDQARSSLGPKIAGGDTAAFLAVNRNKRSLALDLKAEGGREVFGRIAAQVDVVVENFRPGVADRLGVGYDDVLQVNEQIIYASISGFGRIGPLAQQGGFDLIAQGMSGIMSVTGEPGGRPVKAGIPVADLGAGLFCAIGVLSALVHRARTGEGQRVDASLFEAALGMSVWEAAELWAGGDPAPLGSAHRFSAPYQAVRTKDGYLTLGGSGQRQWLRICDVLGRPELAHDPRFRENIDRMRNRDALIAELETVLTGRTSAEWLERFESAGVPTGAIRTYRQVFDDPHTHAQQMMLEMEHPTAGTVRSLGVPVKLSRTPGGVRRPPPALGEHSTQLLTEFGFTEAEVEDLRTRNVIA